MEIEVTRIHKLDGSGVVKAFVDISLDNLILIKGLRIIDGLSGLFVSLPREAGKDGSWYNTVIPLTRAFKEQIENTVLSAYNGGVISGNSRTHIKCNNCDGIGYVNQERGD